MTTATTANEREPNYAQRPIAPPAVRWIMSRLGVVAPDLTARIARRLFFTPLRAALREPQRRILESGARDECEAHGERVVFWSWGEGPLVLLVHGWGGHAGQMTAFVKPLTKAGYRVIAPDLPGHGASSGKMSSLVHFADTITALTVRIGPVDGVIAHSFGAAGVILAVSRGVAVPRAAFLAPWSSFEGVWRRFRDGVGISAPVWERLVGLSEQWLGMRFADVDPTNLAPRLSFPVLILHDPADREVPFEEGESLAAMWRGASLEPVDAGGHNKMLRDPRCVEKAVAFIKPALRPQSNDAVPELVATSA